MPQYPEAWRDLDGRYFVFWVTGVLAVSAWALRLMGMIDVAASVGLSVPAFGAIFWLAAFNCPRCGKSFSGLDKHLSILGGGAGSRNECAYCHLKRGV